MSFCVKMGDSMRFQAQSSQHCSEFTQGELLLKEQTGIFQALRLSKQTRDDGWTKGLETAQ